MSVTKGEKTLWGMIDGLSVRLEGDHANLVRGTFEMDCTLTVGERAVMRRTAIPTEFDDHPAHKWSWNILPKRIDAICHVFRHMVDRYNLSDDQVKELVIHDLTLTTEEECLYQFGSVD